MTHTCKLWTDTVLISSVNVYVGIFCEDLHSPPSQVWLLLLSHLVIATCQNSHCFTVTLGVGRKFQNGCKIIRLWTSTATVAEQQPVIPWHFQSLPVILQGGAGLPIKTLIWQIFGRFWNCALKYLHQRFRPKMRIWPCIHTTLILIRPPWFPYIRGSHCGLIPPQKKCENIYTFIQVFLWIMKMFPDLEEKKYKIFMGFPEALSPHWR